MRERGEREGGLSTAGFKLLTLSSFLFPAVIPIAAWLTWVSGLEKILNNMCRERERERKRERERAANSPHQFAQ